ncbi:LysM peptidoglycan-binding domain-containing protein [Corticicoccus populi]|uniref:LysM peptidoglycan-binding domain-containing protein n=1 Tax=Corticicoccus populi TaxID=1812821 RepID=A0ABW5WWE6_9STAP
MKKVLTALTATAALSAIALSDDAEASSHKVQSGDTLWSIASKNNVSVSDLKSWNNLSSDLIQVNQTLQVNGSSSSSSSSNSSSSNNASEESTSSSSQSSSSASSNSSSNSTYTVKSGDSLYGIARQHGITYRELMSLNNRGNNIVIHPGDTLTVSGNASSNSNDTSSNDTSEASETTSSSSSSSASSNNSSSSSSNASQAPSPTQSSYGTNYYAWGDCTWYAFERRKELGKPVSNSWGNASSWASKAQSAGHSVSSTPSVGAIIQADAWTNNAYGLGHVGVVERVNPDGSILVSEMNFGGGQGNKAFRTISASSVSSHNFIH